MNQSQFDHQHWMRVALDLAKHAEAKGEVPVGAVVVVDNEVIGQGWNNPIGKHDPSAHAEIEAIRQACQQQQNYRLQGASLYVTLEPCAMCAGAIIHSRIETVIFAAHEPRAGAAESAFSLLQHPSLNHKCEVISGVLAQESALMLKSFFKSRR